MLWEKTRQILRPIYHLVLNTLARFSVSFDCFWNVNITTYLRLKSEPVISWNFRAVFVGLLPFKTEIQRFSSKNGQKCNLLCRLKDKGKRYSTFESMISKRQSETRIKTCFYLLLTACSCRGVAVRALIGNHVLENVLDEKVVEFALFYLPCRLLDDATLNLCGAPIYGEKSLYFDIFLQNKDLITRTNIRVPHLTSCKN